MVTAENKTTQITASTNKNVPGKVPFFQPKLTINEPGDEYEQEADKMAEQVMRMPINNDVFFKPKPLSMSGLQRKCHECEEEEKLQRKSVNDMIQRDNKETSEEKAGEDQDANPFQLTARFNPASNYTPQLNYLPVMEELNYRGVPFPSSYFDESLTEFSRQYQFYKRFGLGRMAQKAANVPVLKLLIPDVTGDPDAALANLTTSMAVGSALRRDFPLETERDSTNMHVFNLKTFHFDLGGGDGPNVRRKCAHCEEEEKLQRKENSSQKTEANSRVTSYINSLSSKGAPLPENTRNFFEPWFGYDFSNVQLHTNTEANQSAESINALAYTHKNNIVFGANQYQPDTDTGKKLMAHEVTHVVQQNNKSAQKMQRFCGDKDVRISSWVTVKNQHDFAALDGYSPIKGKIYNVFFDGKSYFFCFNDKRIYFKYNDDEDGVVTDFEKMYNIKVEDGGAHWLQSELSVLAEALSMLSPAEVSNLRGYRFIKEGGVRIDDGDKVTAGLTTQDIIHNDYTIQFWKFCFDGSSDTEVKNTPGISKGVSCVLHEIGHAMMFSRQRPFMEAMYFKDKFQKAYDLASPEKQKAMKPHLMDLIRINNEAEDTNSKKPTVEAEFSKLTKGKGALTPYSKKNENEAFAEAFAIYKVNPELLKRKNLKLYEYFVRAGYQ